MRANFKSIFKGVCISLLKGPMGLAFGILQDISLMMVIFKFGANPCSIKVTVPNLSIKTEKRVETGHCAHLVNINCFAFGQEDPELLGTTG